MTLRDYQLSACDEVTKWIKSSVDPCVIECPTGSGKSHIASELARRLVEMSGGKKVLVLAPSGELVSQNHKKWLATGSPASIFSASVGEKCTRNKVVFGTPVTVANSLGMFKSGFCGVIIDECHGVSPTMIKIIEGMREGNKNLRVIGMSATPYRTGDGYIYKHHYKLGPVREDQRLENPFFHTLVYTIDARYLIEKGYLTKPIFDPTESHYDTSGLVKNKMGQWDAATVDQAFVGKGRLTAQIVADIVEKSKGREGVMIFAATIQHAKEVIASLPNGISALVTGENTKKERDEILEKFHKKEIKYLANVAVLTTGFDASHVSVVAILRATESPGLLTQIIGRGLRIDPNKKDCLVLDYGENIERHFPDGDVFNPDIKSYKSTGGSGEIQVTCPLCNGYNIFSARKNDDGYLLGEDGYFKDLAGEPITNLAGVPIPSHYGRKCKSETLVAGLHTECSYRWSSKECVCGHHNDITARYCEKCREELIDPHEKLVLESARIASDPYRLRIEAVESMNIRLWPSKDESKPDTIRVDMNISTAPYAVSEWFSPDASSTWLRNKWINFAQKAWQNEKIETAQDAISYKQEATMPKEVAFKKKHGSKFFEVVSYGW